MSSIVRALRTLPVYVVSSKTKYNSFDADAAVPCRDTGTLTDALNTGGALGVTQITDITGKVAWKDYIPVQEETGRTVPFSYDANGYFPIKKSGGAAIFTPPEGSAVIWNSSDKSGSMTLSNGNLTATDDVAPGGIRALTGRSSGKHYLEFLVHNIGTSAEFGLALSTFPLNSSANTNNGALGIQSGWAVYYNSTSVGTLPNLANGNVVMVALDSSNGKIWIGRNGTWQGDPAAGTGQLVTAAAFAGALVYPSINTGWYGFSATLRTTAASFSYSIPTGFVSWATA